MLEILEAPLLASNDPDLMAEVKQALDYFDQFELSDWELTFEDLMMTQDNSEVSLVLNNILDKVRDCQDAILQSFDITAADEVTVAQMNRVLFVLNCIEDTEMKDEVLDIIRDGEDDPTRVFCELLAFFNGNIAENYYEWIQECKVTFVIRVREVLNSDLPSDEQTIDVLQDRERGKLLKQYMTFCGNENLMIAGLVRDGLPMGMAYDHYYDQVSSFINQHTPATASQELLAIALVSQDRLKAREAIMKGINRVYASADIITRLMMAVDDAIVKWENHSRNGVQVINKAQA